MCINQIFKDEQLTMMRFSWATDARDIAVCQGQFGMLKTRFQSFPYPHRPYFSPAVEAMLTASRAARSLGRLPGLDTRQETL